MSQCGGHGFDRGTAHVVERILFGERPARSLRVGTQCEGFGVLRVELLNDLRPQQTCGAHLGDFHEVVHADGPEERQARCKRVHAHAGVYTGTQVLQTVGQRVSQLDIGRGARFLHVVTRNRDRVEFGHVLRRVFENVGDDLHREFGRVDVGVAHHELLEDVVLDRAAELVERAALLEAGHNVEGQYRQYGAVHGHRHGHFVQRNAVEQHFHILYRADRYAGFADVAHYARMVGIVAAVRSEVERHRQAFLARGEVTAVECVGFGGGREAGVLADRPRTHYVHRAVRAAQKRCDTCRIVQVLHSLEVFGRVGALDGNLFGGYPGLGLPAIFGTAAALSRGAFVCQI